MSSCSRRASVSGDCFVTEFPSSSWRNQFAMDFLTVQNQRNNGDTGAGADMSARDRNVIIIGGGDTGSDCAGTCLRQGAGSVKQFELLPQPPAGRTPSTPWPLWPMQLRSSHAHEEGTARDWSVST